MANQNHHETKREGPTLRKAGSRTIFGVELPSTLSKSLREDFSLLCGIFGEELTKLLSPKLLDAWEKVQDTINHSEKAPDKGAKTELLNNASSQIRSLSTESITQLLDAYTKFFHVLNTAELAEIARKNFEKEVAGTRPESISDVARKVHATKSGAHRSQIPYDVRVETVTTAHPTEARPPEILDSLRELNRLLGDLHYPGVESKRGDDTLFEIRRVIATLISAEDIRAVRPTVIDEVRANCNSIRYAMFPAAPMLARELLSSFGGEEAKSLGKVLVPVPVRFRSWVGGDRDGNPNVTAEITSQAFSVYRNSAKEEFDKVLSDLERRLIASDSRCEPSKDLLSSIERYRPLGTESRVYPGESHREMISIIRAKLSGPKYTTSDFTEDLEVIRSSLASTPFGESVASILFDCIAQAKAFGLGLVSLDARQHSELHESAIREIVKDYPKCEKEKAEYLTKLLLDETDISLEGISLSERAAEVFAVFKVLKEEYARDPSAVGNYVVSMTHDASDILEVLYLMKLLGLAIKKDGKLVSSLNITPIFEQIDDLKRAPEILADLFNNPAYSQALESRDKFQEILLGHSDSNKDGGYFTANWKIHSAQSAISSVCEDCGVSYQFFHGRGGSVSRGGGRSNRAIQAAPIMKGKPWISFTEQGEVIYTRYSNPSIAHRHLEQIISALIAKSYCDEGAVHREGTNEKELLEEISAASYGAYRGLVDSPEFWEWYTSSTPIEILPHLKIASRPVYRGLRGEKPSLDDLRAIPWVLSHTQTRDNLTGWYGLGTGLAHAIRAGELQTLKTMYLENSFFRIAVDNAQHELAKTRPLISRRYDNDSQASKVVRAQIEDERTEAVTSIRLITGQTELLQSNPTIQSLIEFRNPFTDFINLCQVELLSRRKSEGEADALVTGLLKSVNGEGAALQGMG